MEDSYIKILRKLKNWEWYKKPNMVHFFMHLLISANFVKGKFQGIEIERGQLITGIKKLSADTGISEQSLRTCIKRLKLTGEITTKSTNEFTVITVVKYNDYQEYEKKSTRKLTTKLTNEQQTINIPLTTIEESKESKEIYIPTELEFLEYCKTIKEINFYDYQFSLKSKYKAWVDNKWKDGHGKEIKNWKSKILNTIPFIKPIANVTVSDRATGHEGLL